LFSLGFPVKNDGVKAILVNLVLFAAWSAGQTIAIEQLTHRVPPSAAREYRASTKALSNGKLEESIAHCRKALETDPDNASAHNDLGILYLNDGQTENGRIEFQHAAKLQPGMAMAHVNQSFALLALGRPGDAEYSARKALEITPNDRRSNLLLGWSLIAQFNYSKEALLSLQAAAREYPEAHLAAADIMIHSGSLPAARKEVEAYLASGSSEQKSLAEAWLQLLTVN
jgi:Flp pilus assembly protein TadD